MAAGPSKTNPSQQALTSAYFFAPGSQGWFRTIWDGFDRTMVVYWSCDPKALILTASMPWL